MPTIDEIEHNFALLDDWEDRYRYVIELGRELVPLPDEARSEQNRVKGCASQVWLQTERDAGLDPALRFKGDSDAHIVRGLITILLAFYAGERASGIVAGKPAALFQRLGLDAHLTPQRSNGVRAMVDRIRRDAEAALAPAAS